MDSAKVPEEVQKKFYEAQVDSVRSFGALVETGTAMRELLKKEFGFDQGESLATSAKVSKVIVAWEKCQGTDDETRGDRIGGRDPRCPEKKVLLLDFFSIRKSSEDTYGTATDDMIPGKGLMERRLQMIERNDFQAEPLFCKNCRAIPCAW